MSKLKGEELLEFHKQATSSLRDRAIEAGYFSQKGDRIESHPTAYMRALLEAQGVEVPGSGRKSNLPKVGPRHRLRVGKTGTISTSGAYSRMIGLEPNTFVTVTLVEDGQNAAVNGPAIILTPELPFEDTEEEAPLPNGFSRQSRFTTAVEAA